MLKQEELSDRMRSILIDWIVDVHLKYKLLPETLFITVSMIDKYLQKTSVSRSKLQLVGVTCLLIASKYEEIYPPTLQEFVHITDNTYCKSDILDMEFHLLHSLSFDLTFPTPYRFLERFAGLLAVDESVLYYAQFLIEQSLIDINIIEYQPSQMAAAALLIAKKVQNIVEAKTTKKEEESMKKMCKDLGFKPEELSKCYKTIK